MFDYFLVFGAALLRIIPHPPNFAPIAAIALFGGVYFKDKKQALIIPILAMLLSDIFIGFASFWVTFSVYSSFLLIGLIGIWLKKHKKLFLIISASLFSSILFYLITNFAVWAATPWYTKNFEGLIRSYWLALPFFRNTLIGDLFYVGVLFGVYELAKLYSERRKICLKILLKKLNLQQILKKK